MARVIHVSQPNTGLGGLLAFLVFFAAHLLGGFYSPIQDCDEVFNFWEPTHYLNHGNGLQTWELSPKYAIRSWFYVSIHAFLIKAVSLPLIGSKTGEFYAMRILFGLACALCETRLYNTISRSMSSRVAVFYLLATVSGAGTFHAATAYLPSTFAMLCVTLALASFMDRRHGIKTAMGLTWLAIGTIIGWPFVGILAVPFGVEELIMAFLGGERPSAFVRLFDGLGRSLLVLVAEIAIDSAFFHKLACVPWNIVLYNVFAGEGRGPDIYGTEPWHFYVRNLLINFNLWLLLALASMPLLLIQRVRSYSRLTHMTSLRTFVFLAPFYLWFAVMTIQPHKEERFMYPIYPCLALNAGVALHIILRGLGTKDPRTITSRIPASVKLFVATFWVLSAICLGVWRSAGLATAYSAPMAVYAQLNNPAMSSSMAQPGDTVCVGKEWYRFPSSYHLPDGVKLKFVKSAFSGLLPGEFAEGSPSASNLLDRFPGTWTIPTGMNDVNREDPGKYTPIEQCTFMVDSWLEGHGSGSALEPAYAKDREQWERVFCDKFLDQDRTGIVGRLGWVPDAEWVPRKFKRVWGDYCLLRQVKRD